MKLIKQGAEAILYLQDEKLIKERIPKGYRIQELDDKIRKLRTRSEGRLLQRAENTPHVFLVDEDTCVIEMEFIDGGLVKDILNDLDADKRKRLCLEIGGNIARLHDKNIIHGDLTTSNMLLKEKLYFIDFGLGFISERIEDKAVDLKLLKQALDSKHYLVAEDCFSWMLEGYRAYEDYEKVFKQLGKVEMRGRYKRKHGRYDRGKTPRVQAALARACNGYGILARLDVLRDYDLGRITDEEKARLLALVESGRKISGYGDRGDEISSKFTQVTEGYTPRGRVKI